jgi:queuine tRNA-ribosyltransferase
MGVGTPIDLLCAVDRGIDMFDCIIPSSLAKQGVVYTSTGRFCLARGVYKHAEQPVDARCPCPTCASYSRAYLHHLIKTGEPLGWSLLTRHNLRFYHDLMRAMRAAVLDDTFAAFRDEQHPLLARIDDEHPSLIPVPRRRRNDDAALERFAIRESEHGFASVVDRGSGEIMHAGLDPAGEAEALYVAQSRLAERLREATAAPLVLWDVGLGAAHNAMAALRRCEASGDQEQRPVHLVSFENDVAALRLALRNAARFPHLHAAAPNHLLRFGEWRSERVPLVWTLLEGDFLVRLDDAPPPAVIFYDPFSPKTDAPLWTLECFERVFEACDGHDTELFTYSVSTAVRAALLAAGFVVARGAPTGAKAETTLAMTPAAATHAAARGRTLLGADWLARWRRSDAQFPPDVAPEARGAFAERIVARAQFGAISPASS